MTDYLTSQDVAKILQVSLRSVERWIHDGDLPVVYLPGRLVRIRREDYEEFLDARTTRVRRTA